MKVVQTGVNSSNVFEGVFAIIDNLDNEIGTYIAQRLEALMKLRYAASGIKNRTGVLQRSLTVRYNPTNHSIQLGVMMYGIFLSYGVGPKAKNGKIYKIDDWILASMNGSPRGGDRFSYEPSYRKFGIKARKWVPSDEALQLIINDFIKETQNKL